MTDAEVTSWIRGTAEFARSTAYITGRPADSASAALVPLQSGGSRIPCFCVHPLGGTVHVYQELPDLLGPDRPFFALHDEDRPIAPD